MLDLPDWSGLLALATPHPYTTDNLGWLLAGLIFCLAIAALSSASETALTSVNQIRIKNLAEEGNERARQIAELLKTPHRFLTSILVANNVAIIVASSLAIIIAINLNISEALETVALSFVSLIFCEVAPKNAAVQNAESWALALTPFVRFITWALRPVILAINTISNLLLRLLGIPQQRSGPSVTEEELMLLVNVGEEEGILEEDERKMFHNIFELGETTAREVMVPRIDMVTLEADTPVLQAADVITQGGLSRIPVYSETIDNIIGVLYAKDVLREMRLGHTARPIREYVRPAYFVPESKKLDDLLQEMKRQRIHMAIVFDEYGAVAGLVTIEDLIEEIVGEIQDEYDREEMPPFQKVNDNEYIVDAGMNLDDFNELLGTELEAGEEYDTVGGFILAQLDKMPSVGDTITADGVRLTVLSTKGRRVMQVRAQLLRHGGAATPKPPPTVPPALSTLEDPVMPVPDNEPVEIAGMPVAQHDAEPPPTLSRLLVDSGDDASAADEPPPPPPPRQSGKILPMEGRHRSPGEERPPAPVRTTVTSGRRRKTRH